jgi:hypothetical protein
MRHTPQVRCCGSVRPIAVIAMVLALVTIPRIACTADVTISQLRLPRRMVKCLRKLN